MKLYIGWDLHKETSYITAMDETGKILFTRKIINDIEVIANFVKIIKPYNPHIAVESGSNWYWLVDFLEENNIDIKLSHPMMTKAISSAKVKTDKVDSKILADLLRTNLLPCSYICPKDIRKIRDILRSRLSLVVLRTSLINRIHAIIRQFNLRCPYSDIMGKQARLWLSQLPLNQYYKLTIDNYLKLIDLINSEISNLNSIIQQLAQDNKDAKLLQEIPGIDYYSALLILHEVGDIRRFPTHRHFCSYIGLVPTVHNSGQTLRYGRISKQGNKYLRWILSEAAQNVAINHKNPFRKFYLKITAKKGKAKAKIAVARKIACAIYHMLSKNEHFKLPRSLKQPADYQVG